MFQFEGRHITDILWKNILQENKLYTSFQNSGYPFQYLKKYINIQYVTTRLSSSSKQTKLTLRKTLFMKYLEFY